MYVAINLRKLVKNRAEADKLINDIGEKIKVIKELEITGQVVDILPRTMTSPCTLPIE